MMEASEYLRLRWRTWGVGGNRKTCQERLTYGRRASQRTPQSQSLLWHCSKFHSSSTTFHNKLPFWSFLHLLCTLRVLITRADCRCTLISFKCEGTFFEAHVIMFWHEELLKESMTSPAKIRQKYNIVI